MAKNTVHRIDRNLARRLGEARKEVGFSVRTASKALPNRLSVSHTTIASYEKGTTSPPIDVLAALADIYKRPLNWFLDKRELLSQIEYRNIQPRARLSDKRQFAAQASKWAEAYIGLAQRIKIERQKLNLGADLLTKEPAELSQYVRQVLLNIDDDQPVANTVSVLESFSAWAIELTPRFRLDSAVAIHNGDPFVIFNPRVANERARLNTAFELAALIYRDQSMASEQFKQFTLGFSSSFLIPDSQLQLAFKGKSFLQLIQYKERFGVSLAAMIHRAEELNFINTTASRWLWSQMVKKGWKIKEPGYVWRDRAITFETELELAIQTKLISWPDVEHVTSIRKEELQDRIQMAYTPPEAETVSDGSDDMPDTIKFTKS